MVSRKQATWCCIGQSVVGANHQRRGLPNQDAIAWCAPVGEGLPLIMAVADGHGSAEAVRSQIGANYAVQIAIAELEQFWQAHQSQFQSREASDRVEAELSYRLVSAWQRAVLSHQHRHPFTTVEYSQIEQAEPTSRQRLDRDPQLAYGSTLLGVLVSESWLLYWQLGDGDILCVDSSGHASRPLPKDPSLIANQTTSLCMDSAWKYVRLRLVASEDDWPSLILLSTDGYANSFVSEVDFLQIGPDYQALLQEQGMATVANQLAEILADASWRGSGDDITLGMIQRLSFRDRKPR